MDEKKIRAELLDKIERIDDLEERHGITFKGISFKLNDRNVLILYSQVKTINGKSLNDDIKVEAILYDHDGLIVNKSSQSIYKKNFYMFEIVDLHFYDIDVNNIGKVLLYPKNGR